MKPNRLSLSEGMLSDLGHKDMVVFDEVVEGTNLLGHVPPKRAMPSSTFAIH